MNRTDLPLRAVRSFVRRQGRMSPIQRQALQDLGSNYEIPCTAAILDLDGIFRRKAPCIMEIGFGNGAGFIEIARANPQQNYLGVEVHRPGIANVFLKAAELDLHNIRVINADATEVLEQQIADASLTGVYIFFPDPWPKQKHWKRRLIQTDFVDLLVRKLAVHGILHLATDWEDYARHMLKIVTANTQLQNLAGVGNYSERPAWRPLTKYEQRGQRHGHVVRDLLFQKQ